MLTHVFDNSNLSQEIFAVDTWGAVICIYSLHIHYIFTICSLYVHYTFTIYSLHIHYIFTICSLYVHYMFTICSPYIYYIFTICSLCVHQIFSIYSLYVHYPCDSGQTPAHLICFKFAGPTIRRMCHLLRLFLE